MRLAKEMETDRDNKGGSETSENGSRDTGGSSSTEEATGSGDGDSGSAASLRTGICKWFNVLKGFGFIVPDDGGPEVFVHQSVLKMPGFRSLDEGESLEFQCKHTARGWEATYVAGPSGVNCQGSNVRPLGKKKHKKIRCFNCGQYGNHTASKCKQGPLPKCCYHCKSSDHLVADCPSRLPHPTQQPSEQHTSSTKQDNANCSNSDTISNAFAPET